jgi:rfaE bifunctional protein kinase chain/domain
MILKKSRAQAMPDAKLPLASVKRLSGGRVLVVGDVMLDVYLFGEAERISPEAPVPVVGIVHEKQYLGGAANVARNIKALGGEATLVGIIGEDSSAMLFRALMATEQINDALITVSGRPTTVKTRVLAQRQQMIRLDREDAGLLASDINAALADRLRAELKRHDAVVLSDYAKGVFSGELMGELRNILHEMPSRPPILVDPKPQHMPIFHGLDILTPNLKETGAAAHLPVRNREEIALAGRRVLEIISCKELVVTLGAQGLALFCESGEVLHIPATAREVFDVTGAGDTVIATLALGLAAHMELRMAAMLANYAAGVVVAKVGAGTASQVELQDAMRQSPVVAINQW